MLAFLLKLKAFSSLSIDLLLYEQEKTAEAVLIIRCGERDLNPHTT